MKNTVKIFSLRAWTCVLVCVLSCSLAVTGCKKKGDGQKAVQEETGAAMGLRLEDDYYEAVNQKLLEGKEIPSDSSGWNWFYQLSRDSELVKEEIVSQVTAADSRYEDGSDEQKIRDLYRTAMDMEGRKAAGLGDLKPWLDQINEAGNVQEYAEAVAAFLRETGDSSLFQLFPSSDLKDSGVYSWYIASPDLGLGKETLEDPQQEALVEQYQKYVASLLSCAAGLPDPPSHLCKEETRSALPQAEDIPAALPQGKAAETVSSMDQELSPYDRAAEGIVNFQRDMAASALPLADQWNPEKVGNYYTPDEVQELLANLDMGAVLRAAGIEEEGHIIVMEPELLKQVNSRLTEENLQLLKNYTSFCILQDFAAYLTPEIRDTVLSWRKEQLGIQESRPDQKLALSILENQLGFELGRLYVQRTFSSQDKAVVEEMVMELKNVYQGRISQMEWMDGDTRKAAIGKLENMTVKVGYPDHWPENHGQVRILPPEKGGSLINNVLALKQAESNDAYQKAKLPVDRSQWGMTPQTVNAYYNPSNNEIVFPAGILQPPFYDREASHASNMGGIGMVIAHEMSHAFDDMGAQYDEKGNFNMWWSQKDFENFQKLGKKVAEYYDRQETTAGRTVNGEQTLGENIADLGSLSCVTAQVGDSQEQLRELFLRYASIWAEKITEKEALNRLNTDVHSPGKVRVNAVLRCTDAFYRAYPEIKEGDGMYLAPEDRVGIW